MTRPSGHPVTDPEGHVHWVRSLGPYGCWQANNYKDGVKMPWDSTARFNAFMVANASKPVTGEVHLHLFYDQKAGAPYWRVVGRGSSVCSIEGRCLRARLELVGSDTEGTDATEEGGSRHTS